MLTGHTKIYLMHFLVGPIFGLLDRIANIFIGEIGIDDLSFEHAVGF